MWLTSLVIIPFLVEAVSVLATSVYPNHIVCLCSWDQLACTYLQLQVVWGYENFINKPSSKRDIV
ncbi:hypothetical protein EEJ34_15125 [Vibrio cholerae]|nr:hypothetical protein EEJ34_15125 [Vibrio cholerae]